MLDINVSLSLPNHFSFRCLIATNGVPSGQLFNFCSWVEVMDSLGNRTQTLLHGNFTHRAIEHLSNKWQHYKNNYSFWWQDRLRLFTKSVTYKSFYVTVNDNSCSSRSAHRSMKEWMVGSAPMSVRFFQPGARVVLRVQPVEGVDHTLTDNPLLFKKSYKLYTSFCIRERVFSPETRRCFCRGPAFYASVATAMK